MSIFAEQLKFEPLTERRKILLKIDVSAMVFCLCSLYLAFCFFVLQTEIRTITDAFLQHIFGPLGAWLRMVLGPPLKDLLQICFPADVRNLILTGLSSIGKSLRYAFYTVRPFLSVLYSMSIVLLLGCTAVAYHSGLIGYGRRKKGDQTVLMHELWKIKVRLFEPRISIRASSVGKFRSIITPVVLSVISFSFIYLFFSGALLATGWQFVGLIEPGLNGWFIACLRDARIAYPLEWNDYARSWHLSKQEMIGSLFQFKELPAMPPDLFRFRMFAGALSAFVTAIPVSLTCFLFGIDSFSRKSLTLTPTRLIVGVRTFYFLYFSKAYAWENLLSACAETCKGKSHLVLSFLGSRVVRINLDELENKQRATLIQGLDELAPSCQFSNEVKALFDRTREECVAGYTLFWDDELAKQRKSTVFVPLEQGAKLKGGDLEILRQLSGQGWSCTYLARYNGEFVVVRESVLSDETSSGKRALETLEKEARILSSLNHKSVAKVLDFFVEKERSYLMLEYVVGLDLRKKIGMVGSVDEQRAIEIGIEVCNILQYLHGMEPQVLHRDISPDNLVLTADGQLRLIDFAAAKQFIENATGTMIGKRSYMAPEQLRGKASVRSDIYSAGATLYFLLTGMDPIALNECEVLKQRPEVSPELDLLIRTMTNFEESNRPETIAAVRESLQSIQKQRSSTGSALLRNLRSTLLERDGFKLKVDSREKEKCK